MKKLSSVSVLFIALSFIFILSSCNNIETQNNEISELHEDTFCINPKSEIVLGEKYENPFILSTIQSRSLTGEQIEANYFYFKCRTTDNEKTNWLNEKFGFLSIIPLDREIIQGGCFYDDGESTENGQWYYLICEKEKFDEVVAQNIEVQIIEEMYLDEEDLSLLRCDNLEIPEDTYLEVDIENSSRGIFSSIKKFIKKYIANKPSGKVSVYDTTTNSYVGVKGIKVISNQLGIIGTDTTNSSGKFSISVPYSSLAYKVQMALRFENSDVVLNTTSNASALTGAITYYVASHWIEGLSSINYKLEKDTQYARYATVLNAVWDYHTWCSENSITHPSFLNILVTDKLDGACTPLCHYAAADLETALIDTVTLALGLPLGVLTTALSPDIIIGRKNALNDDYTEVLYSLTFHELSHASHFFGLEFNARNVWLREYGDMISGWLKTISKGGDPFNNAYTDGGTDLIKLIESWGYFSENFIMAWKTGNDDYTKKLEDRKLDDNSISKKYFYYGGFFDLIDEGKEIVNGIVIDYCSNFTYKNLFDALISANVDDLYSFAINLTNITTTQDELENVILTLENNHD